MRQTKVAVIGRECVACGNCVNHCPVQAMSIDRGICAKVDESKCVGCGKCEKACPAGVITIIMREAAYA